MHFDNGSLDNAVRLTRRELDVLWQIASDCTYQETASRLGISLHTVATHIKNAYRKLGVRSGAGAMMRAVELRMFEFPRADPAALQTGYWASEASPLLPVCRPRMGLFRVHYEHNLT